VDRGPLGVAAERGCPVTPERRRVLCMTVAALRQRLTEGVALARDARSRADLEVVIAGLGIAADTALTIAEEALRG
jgi:hypothetical protein